jgi:hypothetical protein
VKVSFNDAKREEFAKSLMDGTSTRLGELIVEAIGLGLMRRAQ